MKLEVVVDSVESAVAAQEGGAYRIEVCTNLDEGGLFPSAGLIRDIRERVSIPLHVMIRPRSGGFEYSNAEFTLMLEQIRIARASGADGVVVGMLDGNGEVDMRFIEVMGTAQDLSVTFHRAYDETRDPMKALETIIAFGAHRLLTSGQKPTAWEGRELIAGLVRQAGGRIGIMAGAGVTADNAARLVDATGVKEIHAARSVRSADGLVEAELVRSLLKRARKE